MTYVNPQSTDHNEVDDEISSTSEIQGPKLLEISVRANENAHPVSLGDHKFRRKNSVILLSLY